MIVMSGPVRSHYHKSSHVNGLRFETSCVDHKDRNDMWPTAAFAYSFTMPIRQYRSGHTAYRRASLNDLYLYTKFHSN